MQEKTVERREIKILKANEKCLAAKIQITQQSTKKIHQKTKKNSMQKMHKSTCPSQKPLKPNIY